MMLHGVLEQYVYNVQKKIFEHTSSSYFYKVSDDEVFTSKLIRPNQLFCPAIAL